MSKKTKSKSYSGMNSKKKSSMNTGNYFTLSNEKDKSSAKHQSNMDVNSN